MIAVVAVAALAAAAAPGFFCGRVSSPGDRLVCADPALAAADRAMARDYAAALKRSGDVETLRLAQRKALAERDACRTRECVADWYEARAKALAATAPPRLAVGRCAATRVANVAPRLEGAPESGAFIAYANGLTQVSYDAVPGMRGSRPGDPVRLCVVSRPRECPAGDTRGSVYRARNGRTGATWTAGDSSHQCGGA